MLEFFYCKSGILQRHRSKADKTQGKLAHDIGYVFIEESRYLRAVLWFRPVAKHHGNGREDLHINPCCVAFVDAFYCAPAVFFDIPKADAVVSNHPRGAVPVMVERNKTAVAEFVFPFWEIFRQDVRVDVYL